MLGKTVLGVPSAAPPAQQACCPSKQTGFMSLSRYPPILGPIDGRGEGLRCPGR